jgi:L-fuculose-phosphate aldolase
MNQVAEARKLVLEACLQLADRGFLPGTGGNISLRIDAKRFAITPSGVDYYSMSGDDICVANLDSLALEDSRLKPSIEIGMHAALLRARSDAAAVIHTHQPLASAVALLGVEVPVCEPDARMGPFMAVVPYAPSGTWLLARALRRRIAPDLDAYLLRNHGLICCGRTMNGAIAAAESAERAARRFLCGAIERAANCELAAQALEILKGVPQAR